MKYLDKDRIMSKAYAHAAGWPPCGERRYDGAGITPCKHKSGMGHRGPCVFEEPKGILHTSWDEVK